MDTSELISVIAVVLQAFASIVSLAVASVAFRSASVAERNSRFAATNSVIDKVLELRLWRAKDAEFAKLNSAEVEAVRQFVRPDDPDYIPSESDMKGFLYHAITFGLIEKTYLAIEVGTLPKEHILVLESQVQSLLREPGLQHFLSQSLEDSTIFFYTPLVLEMQEHSRKQTQETFQSQSLRRLTGLDR